MTTSTDLISNAAPWPTQSFRGPPIRHVDLTDVYARQESIPGYSTTALMDCTVLGIGAGGLGTFVYPALARKGIGELRICDGDVVEASNLNRQGFFPRDLHQAKACCLARNVSRLSLCGSQFVGHRTDFDNSSADVLTDGVKIAFVGVDNNQTRAFASRYFRKRGIPVIFAGVNERADHGYVLVQRAGAGCIGCVFPDAMRIAETEPRRCTPSPAAIDILQGIGALTLYAIDSLLMPGRTCRWTYRSLNLVTGGDEALSAKVLSTCPLCGTIDST